MSCSVDYQWPFSYTGPCLNRNFFFFLVIILFSLFFFSVCDILIVEAKAEMMKEIEMVKVE